MIRQMTIERTTAKRCGIERKNGRIPSITPVLLNGNVLL